MFWNHNICGIEIPRCDSTTIDEFFQFCPNRFHTICVHSTAKVDEIPFVDHNMVNVTFVGTCLPVAGV